MQKPQGVFIRCADGITIQGHHWAPSAPAAGTVVVNGATGVRASYYHRYARFLVKSGYHVVTYDYRGIGESRPASLRRCQFRWRDWGEQDFEAILTFALGRGLPRPLLVVGHSIGGCLPGFAPSAAQIDGILTVGAQYAWWGDYGADERLKLFFKWHVAMPATTLLYGYFPGRRLGWLEDLPRGVALEWAFRRRRLERCYPSWKRADLLSRFKGIRAKVLAVGVSDDPIGSSAAISRTLNYFENAQRTQVELQPDDLRAEAIGHFALFHDRHQETFWPRTLDWLRQGVNPWPHRTIQSAPLCRSLGWSRRMR